MDFEEALAYLNTFSEVDVEPGLARMQTAMELLADPQLDYRVLHIAGTNGKTSVARMCATLVEAAGIRTGLYTSPHLTSVVERIEINGTPLLPDVFADQMTYLRPIFEEVARRCGRHPTYFEIDTVLAFNVFWDAAVGAAIVETGLGGTYDATNVVEGDVAVVTNVSVDHTNFLGTDIEAIAQEKAGIIKSGSRVVTGVVEPDLLAIIDHRARDVGAESVWRLDHEILVSRCENAFGGVVIDVETPGSYHEEVLVPLLGRHQGINAALALAAVEAFLRPQGLGTDAVNAAFEDIVHPGRLEVVDRRPLVVLDGAHNPAGARALEEAVDEAFSYDELILVVGILADKDAAGILEPLAGRAQCVIATAPASGRSLPPEELARLVEPFGTPTEVEPDIDAAMRRARQMAEEDDLVLVAGSLYLIGEARQLFE